MKPSAFPAPDTPTPITAVHDPSGEPRRVPAQAEPEGPLPTRSIVSASSTRRAIGVRISNCPAPRPCFPRRGRTPGRPTSPLKFLQRLHWRIAFPTKNLMEILTHYQSGELTLTLTAEGPAASTARKIPTTPCYHAHENRRRKLQRKLERAILGGALRDGSAPQFP